jgi:hypothetical protein
MESARLASRTTLPLKLLTMLMNQNRVRFAATGSQNLRPPLASLRAIVATGTFLLRSRDVARRGQGSSSNLARLASQSRSRVDLDGDDCGRGEIGRRKGLKIPRR